MDTAFDSVPVDTESPDDAPATPPYRRALLVLLAVLALAAAALGGYWHGRAAPAADSVDVGFARDMSLHHEQAVRMAALVYDRSDDPAIRSLAFDILTTQQGQIGIMSGWLDAWGLAWTSAGPRMAWMGMPTEGLMPGMATAKQLDALRAADGEAADVLFLQLMIPHHQGGVAMATEAAARADQEPVRLLATSMVEAQTLEVAYMTELLQAKGGVQPPAPAEESQHQHSTP
jgi:uncharacterized protein (DUF305 family)